MRKPKVTTNLTCPTCGKTILHARPLKIDPAGILTYTGNRHIIRFDSLPNMDAGIGYVSRCPKTRKAR